MQFYPPSSRSRRWSDLPAQSCCWSWIQVESYKGVVDRVRDGVIYTWPLIRLSHSWKKLLLEKILLNCLRKSFLKMISKVPVLLGVEANHHTVDCYRLLFSWNSSNRRLGLAEKVLVLRKLLKNEETSEWGHSISSHWTASRSINHQLRSPDGERRRKSIEKQILLLPSTTQDFPEVTKYFKNRLFSNNGRRLRTPNSDARRHAELPFSVGRLRQAPLPKVASPCCFDDNTPWSRLS